MTPRLFIDSSVLFSAANPTRGHSRDLIMMSANGEITIVLSNYVLEETRRNLAQLKRLLVEQLDEIVAHSSMEVVEVGKQAVLDAAQWIVLKDAPIIAAAKIAKVDMLVSLDRKHILNHPELEAYIKASIVTPAVAYQELKAVK